MNYSENDKERTIFLVADRECSGVIDLESLKNLFTRLDTPALATRMEEIAARLQINTHEITYEIFLQLLAEIYRNE